MVLLVLLVGGGGTAAWYFFGSAWSGAALASGESSPACQQALLCCKQVMAVQSKDPSKVTMCEGLSQLPEKMCAEWAEKYRTTAKTLGFACQ